MKKTFFLALVLAFLPLSASADLTFIDDTSQFQFAPISLNPSDPFIGDDVRVTVTVYNTSDEEQQGLIDVYAGKGGEQIGENLPVVVPPRGVDSVTMTWHPTVQGYYNMNATLEATVGTVAVNKFNLMVYVEGNGTEDTGSTTLEDNTDSSDIPVQDTEEDDSDTQVAIAPTTGSNVEFSVDDSEISEGDIVVWNFSDGDSYTGNTITRTFTDPGLYTVTRLIIAEDGTSTSDISEFRIASSDYTIDDYFWFWLFLLLLLILAGVIIYTNKQSRKSKKSRRK